MERVGTVVLLIGMLVQGCAVGVRHDYRIAPPQIQASNRSFGLAVQDQRPYVMSGSKEESFTGLSRGGYANPFDVHTNSGAPLADDFAATIQDAFRPAIVRTVAVRPRMTHDQTLSLLQRTKADRLLLMTLREWKSDTYNNTSLYYDVGIEVFDAEAKLLADDRFRGEEDLGGSFWNPPAYARKAVPQAFRCKLQEFFASSRISAALTGDPVLRLPLPAQASGASAADRLHELERLRAKGLVTPEEYERKRAEILGDL